MASGDIIRIGDKADGLDFRRIVITETIPTLTTIVNINGKGYLKTALVAKSTANDAQIIVTIDDKIIFGTNLGVVGWASSSPRYAIGLAQKVVGYCSADSLYLDGLYLPCYYSSLRNIVSGNYPSSNLIDVTQSGNVLLIGELIKFRESLKVEIVNADPASKSHNVVEYYLKS